MPPKKPKSKRGGPRVGAGRKPSADPLSVRMTTFITRAMDAELKAKAAVGGQTVPGFVRSVLCVHLAPELLSGLHVEPVPDGAITFLDIDDDGIVRGVLGKSVE